jgi:hypothetical protein
MLPALPLAADPKALGPGWAESIRIMMILFTSKKAGQHPTGRSASAALVRFWQAGSERGCTAAFSCSCRRIRLDEVKGAVPNGAKRTVADEAELQEPKRVVCAGSAGGRGPNQPFHRIAARWRILLNLEGLGLGSKR